MILILSNKIRNNIIEISKKLLPKDTSGLLNGILLGEKSEISEEIIEDFKTSNLSHILAVSGAHTSYIILGITYILNKSKISKKWVYGITILVLIIFMFITNFSVSVTRACIMAIIVLGSNLLYRKQDFWTSISISLLINLIINPFYIKDIGLQLSYLGTIGIMLLNKNIEQILNKIGIKGKLNSILSVTISAQIMIIPITMYKFNTISFTFFISNILATYLLGANIILGFTTVFVSLISYSIAKMLAILLNFSLKCLIAISSFTSKLPLSSVTIKTPYAIYILLIYLIILIFNYIYSVYNSKTNPRLFQKQILKKLNKENVKKILLVVIILVILFNLLSYLYSNIFPSLKIHFIDVGQGDSCLIITPKNKKILIDGGEETEKVLLPYLLDRRITKIDCIIISHFDSDHIRSDF